MKGYLYLEVTFWWKEDGGIFMNFPSQNRRVLAQEGTQCSQPQPSQVAVGGEEAGPRASQWHAQGHRSAEQGGKGPNPGLWTPGQAFF